MGEDTGAHGRRKEGGGGVEVKGKDEEGDRVEGRRRVDGRENSWRGVTE